MYIQLTNVSKKIKSNDILKDINLRMESGKIYGFKGKNGCGKTMLMRAISGLIKVKGTVDINGQIIGRKVTKAAALLSAVLMASSSVPYGVLIPYNVLAEEVSVDAGAAVQEETAATVGSVTNIKTWDAAGLLAAATTEDNGLSLKGDGWTSGVDSDGASTT